MAVRSLRPPIQSIGGMLDRHHHTRTHCPCPLLLGWGLAAPAAPSADLLAEGWGIVLLPIWA